MDKENNIAAFIIENKKDWFVLFSIVILYILINIIRFFYTGCCLNFDSYYFMEYSALMPLFALITKSIGTYILSWVVVVFVIILIMKIVMLDMKIKYSNLFIIAFLIDPLSVFNMQLGVFDRNIFIICGVLTFTYFFWNWLTEKKFFTINFFGVFFSVFCLTLIWRGYLIIIGLVFVSILFKILFIDRKINNFIRIIMLIISVIFFTLIYYLYNTVLENSLFVVELQSGIFVTSTTLFIGVFLFFITLHYVEQWNIYYTLFAFSFIGYCFFFRLNTIMIPFLYIVMGDIFTRMMKFKKANMIKSIFIFAFIFLLVINYSYYVRDSKHKQYEDVMTILNEQNTTCIISDWGKGHVLDYMTNKTVYYKAHPHTNKLIDIVEYFVGGKETDCSLLWEKKDAAIFVEYAKYLNMSYDVVYVSDVKLIGAKCIKEVCYK